MNLPATLALLIGLLPVVAPAQQTIYRCGANEYTVVPCAGGRPLDALDSRSAAQRAEARRILEAEDKRNKEIEREKQEAANKPPAAASGVAAADPAPAASAARKATARHHTKPEPEPDRAVVAQAPAAKASGTR
jgi:hypothetical protein